MSNDNILSLILKFLRLTRYFLNAMLLLILILVMFLYIDYHFTKLLNWDWIQKTNKDEKDELGLKILITLILISMCYAYICETNNPMYR
jgi:hypothetical protein